MHFETKKYKKKLWIVRWKFDKFRPFDVSSNVEIEGATRRFVFEFNIFSNFS